MPKRLTEEQKIYIVENFHIFKSFTLLMRSYRKHFGLKKSPCYRTVASLIKKFKSTGSTKDLPRSGRRKTATTDAKIEEVRQKLAGIPGMSLTRVRASSGISIGSVHSIATKILELHPYKMKIVQSLKPPDYEKRIRFAKWLLSVRNIEYFFIATDEAYFHLDGAVNNHNFRIWGDSDPEMTLERQLFPKKVLVWCAIPSNKIFGPYFFEKM